MMSGGELKGIRERRHDEKLHGAAKPSRISWKREDEAAVVNTGRCPSEHGADPNVALFSKQPPVRFTEALDAPLNERIDRLAGHVARPEARAAHQNDGIGLVGV